MKKLFFSIVLLLLASLGVRSIAQTEEQLLAQLIEDERNSMEALVLYPEKTRLAILEAAKYPELLIKLESMQARTSESFRTLMERYPKETQELMWDLTRYPGLVSRLANNRSEDPAGILQEYPTEIHQRARDAFYSYRYLLADVDQINKEWEGAFQNLLQDYPPLARDAVRQLTDLPEVLDILTDNIRMTVLVGDIYRRKPGWLLQQLDSLNLVVANERAMELNDWKTSLEENPQAKQEFIASTEDFARDYGYDDVYYNYDNDYYYYEDAPEEVIVRHHYYYHYPYWFGYPYWYVYPRWRPYPWWWDWGFYWGTGRTIVIVNLPSYYFTHWYFYQPYHHHRYPYLSSHFVNHYYGHRTSSSSVTITVNKWRNANRNVVTENWLNEARSKPAAFREFGKFEEARETYNRKHVDKPLTQREFLAQNSRKYPDLAKESERTRQRDDVNRTTPQPPDQRQKTEPVTKPSKREEPVVKPPKREEPVTKPPKGEEPAVKQPRREEPVTPKTRTEPRKQEPAKQQPKTEPKAPERRKDDTQATSETPKVDIPKVDKARDYHKNTWEKSRTEPKQTEPAPRVKQQQPAARPKSEAAPKPKTNIGNKREREG